MADESQKMVERVKVTFGKIGMAAAKAKLFNEKVYEENKPSGSRIVRILSDFAK